MKTKILFISTVLQFLFSCSSDDDYGYSSSYSYANEYAIYETTDETVFREFVLILKPYVMINGAKQYLVTDSLSNVNIKINDKDWGVFTSLDVEPALFDTEENNGMAFTDEPVKYAVLAPYQTSKDTLTTAGEYSNLLNKQFTLEPGIYIFEIESFDFKMSDGTIKTVKTPVVEPVEITENTRNIFVGEFEIKIN